MFEVRFVILKCFAEKELGKADKNYNPECVYKGYRLHSKDHKAIDLYHWYKDELSGMEN
jgi:hypothetical protein